MLKSSATIQKENLISATCHSFSAKVRFNTMQCLSNFRIRQAIPKANPFLIPIDSGALSRQSQLAALPALPLITPLRLQSKWKHTNESWNGKFAMPFMNMHVKLSYFYRHSISKLVRSSEVLKKVLSFLSTFLVNQQQIGKYLKG